MSDKHIGILTSNEICYLIKNIDGLVNTGQSNAKADVLNL